MSKPSAPQLDLFAPDAVNTTGAPDRRRRQAGKANQQPPHKAIRPRTSLRFCVLGSGSGGNSSVIVLERREADRLQRDAVLLDAGFGPYTTIKRLAQAGVDINDVRAICVTHLDRDHFRPSWTRTLIKHSIGLFMHRWHWTDFIRADWAEPLIDAQLAQPFDGVFAPIEGISASPVPLPHDLKGTVGYRIEARTGEESCARIGYATDLGCVPPELIDAFSSEGGVDLLAMESNYDPHLQQASPRPAFLKRRIMGKQGHLSNQQSFEAVRAIVDRSLPDRPRHIVLLHRSSQCNHPGIVREVFAQDARLAGRVVLAEQRRRSRWFDAAPPPPMLRSQQSLFV